MVEVQRVEVRGLIAVLFRNDRTMRYGYRIVNSSGELIAQGVGRKTEAGAREEMLFELVEADSGRR